jgi:hypothetical protein
VGCPRCGSTQGVLIADGVVECTGPVPISTGAHPSGIHGPTVRLVPCGLWYQVRRSSPGAACAFCPVAAVFSCAECHVPLSLSCTAFRAGKTLCAPHAKDHDSAVARAAAEARDAELRELAIWLDRAAKRTAHLQPDVEVEHPLFKWSDGGGIPAAQMRSFRVGSPCPRHGGGCAVTVISRPGWWRPTPHRVTCSAPGWVVHHPTNVLEENWRNVLLLLADGTLHVVHAFHRQLSKVSRDYDSTTVTADNVEQLASAPLSKIISCLKYLADRRA